MDSQEREGRKAEAGKGPGRPYRKGITLLESVVGAKDRETNQVAARAIPKVNREVLLDFVDSVTDPDATVYTDGSSAYRGRENHESVSHSSGEYVRGDVHTNGVKSLWAILKRAYMGTHHWMSPKHLQRYVNELCGRHNIRDLDTIVQRQSR